MLVTLVVRSAGSDYSVLRLLDRCYFGSIRLEAQWFFHSDHASEQIPRPESEGHHPLGPQYSPFGCPGRLWWLVALLYRHYSITTVSCSSVNSYSLACPQWLVPFTVLHFHAPSAITQPKIHRWAYGSARKSKGWLQSIGLAWSQHCWGSLAN